MALLLLTILIVTEISLSAFMITSKATNGEWRKKRLITNGIELATYIVTILLPGIDFSFRFKMLAIVLFIRVIAAALIRLYHKKEKDKKKTHKIVLSAVFGSLLIAFSMIPAFLFNDYNGRPLTGDHEVAEVSAIITDDSRLETFETDGSKREVPLHFYYPKDIEDIKAHSLPLVIFSHGAFGYYQSNTSTYMELASHGYVVISLDHPYHSFFTKDTDGKTIIVDMNFFNTANTVGNTEFESESEVYDITSKWMELREGDMNFVIDTVKKASTEGVLRTEWHVKGEEEKTLIEHILAATDTEKIGLMGHSLGGATAVTIGRRSDVSAVIDLDGTMIGEETGIVGNAITINEEPYTTPLLALDSESHHYNREECKNQSVVYSNNVILDNAIIGYSTYIEGAAHMDFTDLPLFAPGLAKNLGSGDIDHGKCIDTINRITLNFFDCYLKGIGEFSVNEKY